MTRVPAAWIEQTTGGGLILTDFQPGAAAGNLVLLHHNQGTATGRFLPSWAGFMAMRHLDEPATPPHPRRDRSAARERRTSASHEPWVQQIPWFLAQFGMPPGLTYGPCFDDVTGRPGDTFLAAPDGSWCQISADLEHGTRRVLEAGPTPLWAVFQDATEQWRRAGEPGWSRFGLTVTPDKHTVWLDQPAG